MRRQAGLERNKHLVLLVALVAMSVAQPLAHGFVGGFILFDVMLTLLLFAVFDVVFQRRRQRGVALAIGAVAIVSRWVSYAARDDWQLDIALVHHAALLIFFGYAVVITLRGVFEERFIGTDQVFGTVCGYLLSGLVWGNAFAMLSLLASDSFDIDSSIAWQLENKHLRGFLFSYYSLSTIVGLGYNFVTPIRPVAQTALTWTEAVFGQFYLAIVVAELIGLKLSQPPKGTSITSGAGRDE